MSRESTPKWLRGAHTMLETPVCGSFSFFLSFLPFRIVFFLLLRDIVARYRFTMRLFRGKKDDDRDPLPIAQLSKFV